MLVSRPGPDVAGHTLSRVIPKPGQTRDAESYAGRGVPSVPAVPSANRQGEGETGKITQPEPGKRGGLQRNLYVSTRDTRDTRDNQAGRGFQRPEFVPTCIATRDKSGRTAVTLAGFILGKIGAVCVQVLPVELHRHQLIKPTRHAARCMRGARISEPRG